MATPKPRDCFRDTIVYSHPDGDVYALDGVKIYVYYANTETLAEIYDKYDDVDPRENEFVLTSKSGLVAFYADVGAYEISIQDPQQRISDTRFRWNAINTAPGGIPLFALGEDIRRQLTQIGQVIDWWRPVATVPLPAGFELCDGHTVAADQHDFGTGQALVLPDLRNQFIIGADALKADGTASAYGDTAVPAPTAPAAQTVQHPNAPGIRGVGGSNTAKNLTHTHQYAHQHGVPNVDHTHSGATADHYHLAGTLYMPDHNHAPGSLYVSDHSRGTKVEAGNTTAEEVAWAHGGGAGPSLQVSAVVGGVAGSQGAPAIGIGGNTAYSGAIGFTSSSQTSTATTTNTQTTTTTDTGTLGAAIDMRPAHYGLLKLMKVRRA